MKEKSFSKVISTSITVTRLKSSPKISRPSLISESTTFYVIRKVKLFARLQRFSTKIRLLGLKTGSKSRQISPIWAQASLRLKRNISKKKKKLLETFKKLDSFVRTQIRFQALREKTKRILLRISLKYSFPG